MTCNDSMNNKLMKEGKLIIFSAPSGAGKTTIVHHLLA
jgi:guanylate kinase